MYQKPLDARIAECDGFNLSDADYCNFAEEVGSGAAKPPRYNLNSVIVNTDQ